MGGSCTLPGSEGTSHSAVQTSLCRASESQGHLRATALAWTWPQEVRLSAPPKYERRGPRRGSHGLCECTIGSRPCRCCRAPGCQLPRPPSASTQLPVHGCHSLQTPLPSSSHAWARRRPNLPERSPHPHVPVGVPCCCLCHRGLRPVPTASWTRRSSWELRAPPHPRRDHPGDRAGPGREVSLNRNPAKGAAEWPCWFNTFSIAFQ